MAHRSPRHLALRATLKAGLFTLATAGAASAGHGYLHCAINDAGQVKCWGYNGHGNLGQGDTAQVGDGANEMGDNLPYVDLGAGRTAVHMSGGLLPHLRDLR